MTKLQQISDIDVGSMFRAAADDRAVNDTEAAQRLGVSPRYLRQLREEGTGPAYIRLGRRVVYKLADLAAFADAHRVVPAGEVSRG